jgi:outer membrane protein OmpA-like peptidoglycan-associated protein
VIACTAAPVRVLGAIAVLAASATFAAPPAVPLCAGLSVVTAAADEGGDYESIKTIEAADAQRVRIRYSSERSVWDMWNPTDPPKLEQTKVTRVVRRDDLGAATLYMQQFSPLVPEEIPGTTAIGVSRAVLQALKQSGKSEFGVFLAIATGGDRLGIDPAKRPNVYDFKTVARIDRVGAMRFPVLLNDRRVELDALVALADFHGDKAEFVILDDPANPLMLSYRYGIQDPPLMPDPSLTPEMARAFGKPLAPVAERERLLVVKIVHRCAPPPPPAGGQPTGGAAAGGGEGALSPSAAALQQALTAGQRVDVYSIYFTFGSAAIREESKPTLEDIAAVLRANPAWSIGIDGHTDSVASDAANLELSRRRAAAVRDALVKSYGIAAARLVTAGHGESRPKDTNDTLEGRSRNRRVELYRR